MRICAIRAIASIILPAAGGVNEDVHPAGKPPPAAELFYAAQDYHKG